MATKEPDKVQREIEELLDRLDNFVPEERFVEKIKKRRRETDGPSPFVRVRSGIGRWLSRITLGHVLLFGIVLLLSAWLAPGLFGGYARWATLLGLVITVGAFILSAIGWDSRRTIAGPSSEKRWRGQPINYDEPSASNKLREWLRKRRR